MIHFSDPAIARGSKAPNQPSDELASTRVAPGLPCLRTSCAYAAPLRSIQYIRTANLRAMATFRHRVSSSEFQSLIVLPQCGILAHRRVHRFDQQPAHHGVALFADGPESAPSAAGFLARIQSQITDDLSAASKSSDRTDGQNKGQRCYRTDAGMGHQQHRIFRRLASSITARSNSAITGFQMVEQFQKFFPPPAGPRR